jgi:hypothetical protein
MDLYIIIILFALPGLLTVLDFIYYLIKGKRMYGVLFTHLVEWATMVILPVYFLVYIDEPSNNCCTDSAVFSPDHKLTMYFLIGVCLIAFFYSTYKATIHSPILEVLCNSLLLLGITLNMLIGYHSENPLWAIGNLPIILQLLLQLSKSHKIFLAYHTEEHSTHTTRISKMASAVLRSNVFIKYPVLLILCLPILLVIISFLLLFGQKPDSVIRVFTDTYHHGFSKWDYLCDNVACGGHFLCSVGANGHPAMVKPIRYGVRQGKLIICNRQLLIANAFEECIQEHFPRLHRMIRHRYNRVGDFIHRYYTVFENKYFSDAIYLFMKPFEWCFLIMLYLLDARPEHRIARQYPLSSTISD